MRAGKILLALFLTLVLLFVARRLAMVQPRLFEVARDEISMMHNNPGKTLENQPVTLRVAVRPISSERKVMLHYKSGSQSSSWEAVQMLPENLDSQTLSVTLPGKPKGKKLLYYFEVQDNSGLGLANLGRPEKAMQLRFEGKVPGYLIGPHIFCMFAGVFFSFLALFGLFPLLKGKGEVDSLAKNVARATLFMFIGGIPLGILVAKAALGGTGWGGFPFGKDITDNKTLLILLFWLALVILGRGSIFQKQAEKNLVKPGTYGKLTLLGFILVLGLYLIPHSI